jgi:hypothetical protein
MLYSLLQLNGLFGSPYIQFSVITEIDRKAFYYCLREKNTFIPIRTLIRGDMAVNGTIVGGICDLSVPEPVFIPREDAVATTIAPYKGTDGYECILLPQTIIEGFSVNFSYDGKLDIWTAEEPIELQKGVEHTLTLNVNETARLATMQMKYRATGQIIDQK